LKIADLRGHRAWGMGQEARSQNPESKRKAIEMLSSGLLATGLFDCGLLFGVDSVVESDLLSKGKLIFRFPAGSFTDLTARRRALLAEMAIRARMFLGAFLTARGIEKALILR
jgi:hypothetical protein